MSSRANKRPQQPPASESLNIRVCCRVRPPDPGALSLCVSFDTADKKRVAVSKNAFTPPSRSEGEVIIYQGPAGTSYAPVSSYAAPELSVTTLSRGGDSSRSHLHLPANPTPEKKMLAVSASATSLQQPSSEQRFAFDRVFPPTDSQQKVYESAALPIVQSLMAGYHGTILAYGQSSSGKTHTMLGAVGGPSSSGNKWLESSGGSEYEKQAGVLPRALSTVFETIYAAPESLEFIVKVSVIEIYGEKIRDLMAVTSNYNPENSGTTTNVSSNTFKDSKNLKIKESPVRGLFVEDAVELSVSSQQEILQAVKTATLNRAFGMTNLNEHSSRSHMVFSLLVEQRGSGIAAEQNSSLAESQTSSSAAALGGVKRGKLFIVDLAGSERVGKTGATGDRLEEAKMINKSLAALGNVINALTSGVEEGSGTESGLRQHVPYRDSKLTRLLTESLGGNSKTCLIVTVNAHREHASETLSTLKFGQRAKLIKNDARVNQVGA